MVRRASRISTYSWNRNTAQWGPSIISTYSYDTQGRTTSVVSVDSASQVPRNRVTYTYNTAGQTNEYLAETWQGSAWQNTYRYLATYNAQNRVIEYLDQNWVNGAWQSTSRNQFAYNAQGHQTQTIYQQLTNNVWVTIDGNQYTYTYDAAGRMTEQQWATWNATLSAFLPTSRYLYTYTGTNTSYSSYDYQTWTNGAWLNESRVLNFSYTSQNRIAYYETQIWDGTAWQLYSRTTYTYPASGLGFSYLTEKLTGTIWGNQHRYTNAYDAQGTNLGFANETWTNNNWIIDFSFRYTIGYNANNDIARRLSETVDRNTNAYVNLSKSFYSNYQTITLGNKAKTQETAIQLYPNPAMNNTTMEMSSLRNVNEVQVTVLNALGQTVQQFTIRPQAGAVNHALDLASLPAGVYSVCVRTAEGTVTKRLVRE